ncbi:M20 family metallopeptidase [Streptomyces flaveolus]|uniref:M20 family metallopeptidase n=1 Tax=Streptomyces flaveolus TaxID=67297 RepID=A0ABV1VKP3_9ACTN
MTNAPHHSLLEGAEALLGDVISLRRRLHAHPELGLHLPATQSTVLEELANLPLTISTGSRTTSVTAVLDSGRPGPTTLLRADMDALPLTERTGLPYASTVEGVMHACGHDAHTAMLIGAARLLTATRDALDGRVIFMFQPGEEGAGGAKIMLEEGLLQRFGPVDRAFALHVMPLLPSGVIAARPGPTMASVDTLDVVVTGQGGHSSMPHTAVDPVPVACEIVMALQSMMTRRLSAFEPAVLTVGSVRAGSTANVIPSTATLRLTVRAVSEEARTAILEGVDRVSRNVAAAHLCGVEIDTPDMGYPVTVSDPRLTEHVLETAASVLGDSRVARMPTPVLAGEDWSFVLQQVPGCLAALGAAPSDVAEPASIHSDEMVMDETAMAVGVALHAAVALSPGH